MKVKAEGLKKITNRYKQWQAGQRLFSNVTAGVNRNVQILGLTKLKQKSACSVSAWISRSKLKLSLIHLN